jgi:hypothetical protein
MDLQRGSEIPYLGSFKSVDVVKCLNRKLDLMVKDEADLPRPALVSLVIPTKIDVVKGTRELELDAMRRVMSECSQLVDVGYIDEIVVIDASVDEGGKPVFDVLEKVVETAFDELDLFRRQVMLINEHRAMARTARRGFFDFVVKAVHQFDENIVHVLKMYSGFDLNFPTGIPAGKGAALWLTTPITQGDVICFTDSDIMNFSKEFVIALCNPIIESWHQGKEGFSMVKACYRRLTVGFDPIVRKYIFGGRVTRLLAVPLLRVLTRVFPEVFSGMDSLRYPLAGEFSIRKQLLESIHFPNDYSIEFSMLKQALRQVDRSSLGQVDLEVFHHIGQSPIGLEKMVKQIVNCLMKQLDEEGIKLSGADKMRILSEYMDEVCAQLPRYEEAFSGVQKSVSSELGMEVSYSKETDINSYCRFLRILGEALGEDSLVRQLILPSWTEVAERVNYVAASSMLRRRANQSTFARLKGTKLFYGL